MRAPAETARAAGLDHAEVSALAGADRVGLVMAAASFRAKRARRKRRSPLSRWPRELIRAVSWRRTRAAHRNRTQAAAAQVSENSAACSRTV